MHILDNLEIVTFHQVDVAVKVVPDSGFAFFGIYGTERNLEWLDEVQAAVPKGTPLLVAMSFICNGGLMCENIPTHR